MGAGRALLAGLLGLASACGYRAGLELAPRVTSLSVEFFGNETLERDLERQFHDELTAAVRDLSDAPLATRGEARYLLRGTIREYRRRGGIRSADNELLETGIYFEVQAALYAKGAEGALRGPIEAGQWVGYFVQDQRGESEARQRAMRNVAERVALELLTPEG